LELQEKMNVVAMNMLNDSVYAFNCDGDFIEFKVDLERKNIIFDKKQNMSQFKMEYAEPQPFEDYEEEEQDS
jgi:hypothetical protein